MKFRIIPTLLFKNGSLVKSVSFENHRIVGDVASTIKVFSKRQADEMVIFDLDAKKSGRFNDHLIKTAVNNCNMPLTMGGGIEDLDQASRLIDQGCDKVSVCSMLYERPAELIKIAHKYGTQALVATIDYRVEGNKRCLYSSNGSIRCGELDIESMALFLSDHGVGEVIFSCIDRDGNMNGYDKDLIADCVGLFKIPLIVSGGCNSSVEMWHAEQNGFTGAAAGSIFYWKGDSIISLKSELLDMGSNVREIV